MTIINQKSISGITSITFASAGDDLLTFHSNNGTERFRIDNSGSTKITAGIVTTLTVTSTSTFNDDVTFTGTNYNATWNKSDGELEFADNAKATFGADGDLMIYHDGSHSYVLDNGTGDLRLASNSITRITKGDSETCAAFNVDGASELYYDNTKKFETTTDGATITGELGFASGGTYQLKLSDNQKIRFGGGNDLQIYHNGTNSLIENSTGELLLRAKSGENSINCNPDGSVEIFHDNSKKFETKSDGIDVTGEVQCDSLDVDGDVNFDGGAITFSASANTLDFGDSVKANFGNGDDLQIYHDGTHSYINDGGTGNLKVLTTSMVVKNAADSEIMLQATQNGSVDLYYDNSKKFETLTNGVRAQGGILFGSDTADANALDDYEEGTWTPTAVNFDGSVTINSADYVKVGKLVHINMYISFSNTTDTSNVLIGGLPFTVTGENNHYSLLTAHSNGNIPDLAMRAQGTTTQLTAVYLNNSDGDAKPNYNHVRGQFIIAGGTYYST